MLCLQSLDFTNRKYALANSSDYDSMRNADNGIVPSTQWHFFMLMVITSQREVTEI